VNRDELDLIAVQQSTRFDELNDKGRAILNELITSRETLSQTLQEHQETTQVQHCESRDLVETQHKETRSQVFAVVNAAATSLDNQFQFMRREIEDVNNAMAQNKLETFRIHQEVKAIAQAILAARSDGQRKKLQQRSNLATEALYSLLSVFEKLTVSQSVALHSTKQFSN
jgi:hypothetical protein